MMISIHAILASLFSLVPIILTGVFGGILQELGRKTAAKVIYVFNIIEAQILWIGIFALADYSGFISMSIDRFAVIVFIMIAIALAEGGVMIRKKISSLKVFVKVIYVMAINVIILGLVLVVGMFWKAGGTYIIVRY